MLNNKQSINYNITTINNISVISWQSVLLVEENGVPRENHRPVASYLAMSGVGFKLTTLMVIGPDCKSINRWFVFSDVLVGYFW
jgi:hypothetical protein